MSLGTRFLSNKLWNSHYSSRTLLPNVIRLDYSQCCTCFHSPAKFKNKKQTLKRITFQQVCKPYSTLFSSYKLDFFKFRTYEYIKKLIFWEDEKKINLGFNLYGTLDDVEYNDFFTSFNLEDTFYSWYRITELHVWMLLVKLMESKDNNLVRKALVKGFWLDVEKRAKIVSSNNPKFRSNMTDLYHKIQMALFVYDEGYLLNDKALAGALWYQFFDKKCNDPRLLEVLVSYIRFQLNHMNQINITDMFKSNKGRIWTPLEPHCEKLGIKKTGKAAQSST